MTALSEILFEALVYGVPLLLMLFLIVTYTLLGIAEFIDMVVKKVQ